jgi:hypothetical protein
MAAVGMTSFRGLGHVIPSLEEEAANRVANLILGR